MNNMEMSILEAGGETGKVYETHTHSITEREHQRFLDLQRQWKEQEKRREQNKTSK